MPAALQEPSRGLALWAAGVPALAEVVEAQCRTGPSGEFGRAGGKSSSGAGRSAAGAAPAALARSPPAMCQVCNSNSSS